MSKANIGKYCTVGLCKARFLIQDAKGESYLLTQIDQIPGDIEMLHKGWKPAERCKIAPDGYFPRWN